LAASVVTLLVAESSRTVPVPNLQAAAVMPPALVCDIPID